MSIHVLAQRQPPSLPFSFYIDPVHDYKFLSYYLCGDVVDRKINEKERRDFGGSHLCSHTKTGKYLSLIRSYVCVDKGESQFLTRSVILFHLRPQSHWSLTVIGRQGKRIKGTVIISLIFSLTRITQTNIH
jgi:hypothetical protein